MAEVLHTLQRLVRSSAILPNFRAEGGSAEPLFVILSACSCSVRLPLGSYLITAGICLMVVASVAECRECRMMQMNDEWVEQQMLAERFRNLHAAMPADCTNVRTNHESA